MLAACPKITFDDLPNDIISTVAGCMDDAAVCAFKHVNKRLHLVLQVSVSAHRAMLSSAAAGDIPMSFWLHSMNCTESARMYPDICKAAARNGHAEMFCWLVDNLYDVSNNIVIAAAFGGSVAVFEKLKSAGISASNPTVEIAAALGHIPLMQWLRGQDCMKKHTSRHICIAAATGQTPMVELLLDGKSSTIPLEEIAAYNGHLDTVKWLIDRGFNAYRAKNAAMIGGQTHVRIWLDKQYPMFTARFRDTLTVRIYDKESPKFVLNRYK